MGQRSPVWPTKRPSRRTKAAFRPIIIGVNAAKDEIRRRLHIDAPGPGYMHFPVDRDIGYYQQLISERSVAKTVGGVRFRVWALSPGRANEALDCRVYAYAALEGLVHFGLQLNRTVSGRAPAAAAPPPPTGAGLPPMPPIPPPAAAPTTARRSIASRLA